MEEPISKTRSDRAAAGKSVPGGMTATIAAAVAALACFLPWFRIDFAAMTSSLQASFQGATDAAMPGMAGFGSAVSEMLGGSGTINAAGVDAWVGVAALVAFAVAGTLLLIEGNAASKQSRGPLLVAAVVASVVGSGFVLYSVTQLGGPVGIHIGLVVTILAAVATMMLSVRRMQLFGALESTGQMAA